MNFKDVPYYLGLMGGLIVGSLALGMAGVSGLWQLLGGLAVGVGAGYVLDQAFGRRGRDENHDRGARPGPPEPEARAAEKICPNPQCGWKGARAGQFCPMCGERLPE